LLAATLLEEQRPIAALHGSSRSNRGPCLPFKRHGCNGGGIQTMSCVTRPCRIYAQRSDVRRRHRRCLVLRRGTTREAAVAIPSMVTAFPQLDTDHHQVDLSTKAIIEPKVLSVSFSTRGEDVLQISWEEWYSRGLGKSRLPRIGQNRIERNT
jgi:hypothetical protein